MANLFSSSALPIVFWGPCYIEAKEVKKKSMQDFDASSVLSAYISRNIPIYDLHLTRIATEKFSWMNAHKIEWLWKLYIDFRDVKKDNPAKCIKKWYLHVSCVMETNAIILIILQGMRGVKNQLQLFICRKKEDMKIECRII